MIVLRRLLLLASALYIMEPICVYAQSASWPARPIKLLAAVSAGSSSDIAMRVIAQAMSVQLGQPIVIEDRPGAGGVVGATAVARAAPDGYTLGLITTNHVINPAVVKDLPYDALKDFTPISMIASGGMVLLAHLSVNVRTVPELVALAKKSPGHITYGSSGSGGLLHLYTVQIEQQAGIELQHIPYKGLAPMLQDLVGGQVQLGMAALPAAQPFMASGQVRALAVTSADRMMVIPNVPSLAESGLPGYNSSGWMALVGPAGLIGPIQARIHAALKAALADSKVSEALVKAGMEPAATTPEETVKFLRIESEKHLATAKRVGLKPQ